MVAFWVTSDVCVAIFINPATAFVAFVHRRCPNSKIVCSEVRSPGTVMIDWLWIICWLENEFPRVHREHKWLSVFFPMTTARPRYTCKSSKLKAFGGPEEDHSRSFTVAEAVEIRNVPTVLLAWIEEAESGRGLHPVSKNSQLSRWVNDLGILEFFF